MGVVDVSLSSDGDTFLPGDTVQGTIKINTSRDIKSEGKRYNQHVNVSLIEMQISALYIKLKGVVWTSFQDSDGDYHSEKQICYRLESKLLGQL